MGSKILGLVSKNWNINYQLKHYSTSLIKNKKIKVIITKNKIPSNKINFVELPWAETDIIIKSRLVIFKMLDYLKEIKSPLYDFIMKHPRFNYLISTKSLPKINTKVLSLKKFPHVILAELASEVLPVLNKITLLYSSVYVFMAKNGDRTKFYIGSRIAGSNRNKNYLEIVKKILEPKISKSNYSNLIESMGIEENKTKGLIKKILTLLEQFVIKVKGWSNIKLGYLVLEPSIRREYIKQSDKNYKLNVNEYDILKYLEIWIIRVQEQIFISSLNPSLNTEKKVKLKTNWTPKIGNDLNNKLVKTPIIVHKAGTNIILTKGNIYTSLLAECGITRYNTLVERLNNSKVTTYSPTFKTRVTFLQEGMQYKNSNLKGYTITTTPIQNIELNLLPDGITALCENKKDVYKTYLSSNHAAYELDGKTRSEYISRYINIERLVKTSKGSFFFVKRPDFISSIIQFRKDKIKGSKVVLFDPRYNIYVLFKTKANLSEYFLGHRKGYNSFSRYLETSEGKPIGKYKNLFTLYTLSNLPANVSTITETEYYDLIGTNRLILDE